MGNWKFILTGLIHILTFFHVKSMSLCDSHPVQIYVCMLMLFKYTKNHRWDSGWYPYRQSPSLLSLTKISILIFSYWLSINIISKYNCIIRFHDGS